MGSPQPVSETAAEVVVGVAAAADERAVADAAGSLGERAAGRGSCGELALGIERDGADGIVRVQCRIVDANLVGESLLDFGVERGPGERGIHRGRAGRGGELRVAAEGGVRVSGELGLLEAHQAVALARNDELGVVDEAHAVLRREALGAGADEVDVRRFVEHEPRGLDRVAQALDAGDAAGAQRAAVHHQRVELHAAVAGEEGTAAGVEGVVVLHDGDGGLDGIQCGAVLREHSPTGGERVGDAALVGCDGVVGHGPGAAVDEKNGLAGAAGRCAHRI